MPLKYHAITWAIAIVLIAVLVVLWHLKKREGWVGWRRGLMILFGRSLGRIGWFLPFLAKKVPWKPALIWGPWILFALGAGYYGFANWRGAKAWAEVEAELRDRGESLVFEDYLPKGVADEDNAWFHPAVIRLIGWRGNILATAGLAGLSTSSNHYKGRNPDWGESSDVRTWLAPPMTTGSERDAALRVLEIAKTHFAYLDGLREAFQRPKCAGPHYLDEWGQDPGSYRYWIACNRTLADLGFRIELEAKGGRGKECGDDLIFGLQFAERTRPLGSVVAGSWRMRGALWEALRQHVLPDDSLLEVQGLLERTQAREDYVRALQIQRISLVTAIDHARDHRQSCLDFTRCGGMSLHAPTLEEVIEEVKWHTQGFKIKWGPAGWFNLSKTREVGRLTIAVDLIRRATDREMLEEVVPQLEVFDEQPSYNLLRGRTYFAGSNEANNLRRLLMTETHQRLAIVAVAAQRFYLAEGRYPATREELIPAYLAAWPIDATNLEPIGYELKGDGTPRFFSYGFNKRPDNIRSWNRDDQVWQYTPPRSGPGPHATPSTP